MAIQEIVNTGTLPNDGEGDPLRVAFQKINNNFSNLFSTAFSTSTALTVGNTAGQVIFETPIVGFTQGMFQIRSSNPDTTDSQTVVISAQITNDLAGVKFTGYGTTFNGTPVTRYDMDVLAANVRILSNPLTAEQLTHFVSSQTTYLDASII